MGLDVMNVIIPWIEKFCLIACLLEIIIFVADVVLTLIRRKHGIETFKGLEDVLDEILWAINKPMVGISSLWVVVSLMAIILHLFF